jgi:protein TonB
MGMFEQSMLLDTGTGKRTGAVAASLTLQTLAVGLLFLIPLLYSDRLPLIRPWLSITIPLPPPIPEPPVERMNARTDAARPSLITPRVFHPDYVQPSVPTAQAMISDDPGPITLSTSGAPATGFSTSIGLLVGPAIAPGPVVRPVVEPIKVPEKPRLVSSDVQAGMLIHKVIPLYPEIARRVRVSGTVRLVGVIAKDGTIVQLQVVSGNPLLVGSAVEAVRQWVYRPTILNGAAVEVVAPIDVIFTLAQ